MIATGENWVLAVLSSKWTQVMNKDILMITCYIFFCTSTNKKIIFNHAQHLRCITIKQSCVLFFVLTLRFLEEERPSNVEFSRKVSKI